MKPGAIPISIAIVLIGIGVAVWLVHEPRLAAREGANRPNVIVINVDTLRADHLSQYGYRRRTSLALEDFAGHSTRFADTRSPAPWTKPSVASLMTGLAPARHGATGRAAPLSLDAHTLAELLQAEGWRTAAFSDNPFVSRATQLDQGFDLFHYQKKTPVGAKEKGEGKGEGKTKERPRQVNSHETQLYGPAEEMFAMAEGWVLEQGSRPFLLYLQPMNVHGPYKVPPKARTALLGRPPATGFRYYRGAMQKIMMKRQLEERDSIDALYLRSQRELYDTSIHYVMNVIAEFLVFLKSHGLYDDSLIIITSDHGEEMFDHGGFGHAWTLYDEVLSVPLFIKMPGQKASRVVEESVSTLDIFPTILRATGVAAPDDLDGTPLHAYLDPISAPAPRAIYFSTAWRKRCLARGVQEGPWKLIEVERSYEIPEPRVMLFNVEQDPNEERDVSAEHPEIVSSLGRKLAEQFDVYRANRLRAEAEPIDRLDEDALRALGYVE